MKKIMLRRLYWTPVLICSLSIHLSAQSNSGTNSVLDAFAKAAAANPNDSSGADLTMKALNMLTGGVSVSAQDSAAAISSFKKSSGGSGMHYEYSMMMTGKNSTTKDSSNLFFTDGGEGRLEMKIPIPGVQMKRTVSLGHFDQPKFTVLLYPESKTYLLRIIDPSMMSAGQTYQVTKIGTETVLGYSCIHSKLVSTVGSGRFKSTSTIEIWTSTAVPGYSLYKKMSSMQTSQMAMFKALENAGASGIFVKMMVAGKDYSYEQNLIKAEESKFSADLFRIPSGYTQSNGNVISNMMPSAK
jgi:hypothetical protein